MKRGQPLRSDPAKTRDWERRSRERALERSRGREGMLSSFLRAATAPGDFRDDDGQIIPQKAVTAPLGTLKRSARKTVRVPARVRAAALRRSGGLCVVCVHDARKAGRLAGTASRAVQCHHVLPKHRWPEWLKEVDNLVGVCEPCHARHESAFRRIPRAALHQDVIDFAVLNGVDWYLDRTYPA